MFLLSIPNLAKIILIWDLGSVDYLSWEEFDEQTNEHKHNPVILGPTQRNLEFEMN